MPTNIQLSNLSLLLFSAGLVACGSPSGPAGSAGAGNDDTSGSAGETTADAPGDDDGNDGNDDADGPTPGDDDGNDDDGDPDGTSDDGDDADDSGTGSPAECDLEVSMCMPPPPKGWFGPVAVTETVAGTTPVCPASYPTPAAVSPGTDFFGPPPACGCECGEPQDAACGGGLFSILVTHYAENGCTGNTTTSGFAVSSDPVAVPPLPGFVSKRITPLDQMEAEVSGGSCAPQPSQEILPAGFLSQLIMCNAEPAAACDDGGLCLPKTAEPFEAGLCVYANGEQACPVGTPYVVPRLMHTDFVDDRACSECTCGDPSGACVGEALVLVGTGELELGEASPCMAGAAGTVVAEQGTATAACAGFGGAPMGEAMAIDPVTVCCTL